MATITFGNGSDNETGTDQADNMSGGLGNDTLSGSNGNDTIDGGLGADSLLGGVGNDVLIGSGTGDVLRGGAGDDTYRLSGSEAVFENSGGGKDTVVTAQNYTLASNFENLVLDVHPFLASGFSGTGNEQNNVITGNRFSNHLRDRVARTP